MDPGETYKFVTGNYNYRTAPPQYTEMPIENTEMPFKCSFVILYVSGNEYDYIWNNYVFHM